MKLAFSTLGCPDWSLNDILLAGKELGYDGVEIRGMENEMYAPLAKPFLPDNRTETIKKLASLGLEIPILTSAACLTNDDKKRTLKEAYDYIDLASEISCNYVRILITPYPEPTKVNLNGTTELYQTICDYAAERGVSPLIETNGPFSDTHKAAEFMKQVKRENAGILWDVHHPYRFYQEAPSDTVSNIKDYVKYVHIKDSVMENEMIKYRMMGKGDIPIKIMIAELKKSGYNAYLSLEWVKRWNPDLEDGGVVFSHFLIHIRRLLETI